MTSPMHIRPCRSDELAVVKEITVEAFDGVSIDQGIENAFGPIHDHDWRWRKARHIDEDAQRNPDGIFVAEEDGRILGYITTWIDPEAGIGNIPNLAVVKDMRGHGLGHQLLEFAFEHFRRQGIGYAKIETLAQNAVGYHVYTSMGFREVARQVHFVKQL